jgi:transcriptional regulator with XRE-family HTH domain/uncharacterized cupin superfamily protein
MLTIDGDGSGNRGVTAVLHPLARERIRSARVGRSMSLRELGRRIGLSASLLSQIENGKTEPSVSTLYALVSELDLSLDALLDPSPNAQDRRDAPIGSAPDTDSGRAGALASRSGGSPVINHDERRILHMDSGVVWERLTRGPSDVDVLLVTYEAGGTSSSTGKRMTHGGREFAYLFDGQLTLELGFETHQIHPGDSLEFDSSIPHLFHNEGTTEARGVWFVVGEQHEHGTARTERAAARNAPLLSAVDVLKEFRTK